MDKIIRVNVRTKETKYEDAPEEYLKTGGRGLIAKIMLKEVKPTCEPLGRYNKLIIANGLLTGTAVSSASRISIGAKSPLTGGIKESNGGGITAMWLAQNNIKAVIIEDIPDEDKWYYVKIEKDKCSLEPADNYKGMGTFDFCEEMIKKYPDCAVTCIGPAGEMLYNNAGIATMDKEKNPNRYSGRGGLGAVMGSKKIKGLVVTQKGTINIEDKEKFSKAFKEYTKILKDAPSSISYRTLGTAGNVRTVNDLTGLPVKNFKGEKFDLVENIYGETLFDLISERGGEGKTFHACMPGCVIQCSNVVPDKEGKKIVSPLEYETIGLLGSNLGIGDLDAIAKLNAICNDFGIDTIETGGAIGVAMEAGIIEFGDIEGTFNLIQEIKKGTILGRVLGSGAVITGKVLGVTHIPAVNGQSMPAYDPRVLKGMGVTFATTPMGADHTYGPVLKTNKGYVEASKESQLLMAILDSLGFCMFIRAVAGDNYQLLVDLVNGRFGWDLDIDWIFSVGRETISDEHKFNELAGFNMAKYNMPEEFVDNKIESINSTFDIEKEELDELINSFK